MQATETELLQLPVNQLTASRFQPAGRRAGVDLVASVKERGVITPGLARPLPEREPDEPISYEVVFGHCRLDAARQAGLKTMPFLVRAIGDTEALELLLVENLQREGLHALDEAEGYERLRGEHDYTTESIAEKIGKSKAYVYGRLKLCALTAPSRLAFREGKLTDSLALYLARVPGALQGHALAELLDHHERRGEPMSAREAQGFLQREYMLELKEAPFELDDGGLVPEAGPCTVCPKRTGTQRELFADVADGDVCTDPICYRGKVDALWTIRKARAEEKGQPVLSADEAKEVFPGQYGGPVGALIALDSTCYNVPAKEGQYPTYKKLLGAQAPVVLAQHPHTGEIVELADRAEVFRRLEQLGVVKPAEKAPAKKKKPSDLDGAAALQFKVTSEVLQAVSVSAGRDLTLAGWRVLFESLAERFDAALYNVAGRHLGDVAKDFEVPKLTLHQIRGLVVDLVLSDRFLDNTLQEVDPDLTPVARAFGVDVKPIEKRLKDAAAASAKAAAAPAKKKGGKK